MRTAFPPLDKDSLVDYLDNYTRLLCKHKKEDRYSHEVWFKTKMCLKYLDGILFGSDDSRDKTNYASMTLENYLEFMLNENLIKNDPSRYVRYIKRYKVSHGQKNGEQENLFNSKKMPQESLENTTDPQQYKYEMDMKKNIVPKPKKLEGVISVGFIAIAIIVIILLFYYMV